MAEKEPKPRYEYKLRRTTDGLYSGGGMSVRWGGLGKTWRTIGPLKNHLHQHAARLTYSGTPWEHVEIVEVELRQVAGGTQPALPIVTEMVERKRRQREASAEAAKRRRLAAAEAEVARLRKEVGAK